MATFLFKTEPTEYSFEDLERDGRTTWDGVSNPQALGFLRKAAVGDDILIYETGSRKAIVGTAQIVRGPGEDPDHPGLTADGAPKVPVVDIAPVRRAASELPLSAIKQEARFKDLPLVRQPRLSIMLIPDDVALELKQMTGLAPAPAGRSKGGR